MQVENEREKELRLARRDYLRELDDKLNSSKPKTKKKREEAKVVEEKTEEEEVVSIDEASNEDALFNEEE